MLLKCHVQSIHQTNVIDLSVKYIVTQIGKRHIEGRLHLLLYYYYHIIALISLKVLSC